MAVAPPGASPTLSIMRRPAVTQALELVRRLVRADGLAAPYRPMMVTAAAEALGTTPRALRHYESLGLITPRRLSGRMMRVYDEANLLTLEAIVKLRQAGLPIEEIRELLESDGDTGEAELRARLCFALAEAEAAADQARSLLRALGARVDA